MDLARLVSHENKILLPSNEIKPSEAIESRVDLWFLNAANTLKPSARPPDDIAPWILVRLTCASVQAGLYEDGIESPPTDSSLVSELLKLTAIDLWHAKMKAYWLANKKPWHGTS